MDNVSVVIFKCVLCIAVIQSSEAFEITDTIEMVRLGFTFIPVSNAMILLYVHVHFLS